MRDDLAARLARPRFPRSATYDPQWLVDNWMGPQPLWLLEWLWPVLDLPSGARVLDLGCGTALTSIFLAKEYDAQVVAADLWVDPKDNWSRIETAGCAGGVIPLRAEAHDLKFAEGYFDAIVGVDAYHYFGTDERYLAYLARFPRFRRPPWHCCPSARCGAGRQPGTRAPAALLDPGLLDVPLRGLVAATLE